MTLYALRLQNGTDTAPRARMGDALGLQHKGALQARTGLRRDGGGVVSVVAGSMQVQVTPFMAWVDGSASDTQAGYPVVSDATATLTVDDGAASLARVDTIAVVVKDNAFDGSGSTSADLVVVKGTPGAGAPALPGSAVALRDVNVPAGLSAGSGGLSSANLGTDRRAYLTALGGILPVTGATERDALGALAGQAVFRLDTATVEVHNGLTWKQLRYTATNTWHTVGAAGEPAFTNGWANNSAADAPTGFLLDSEGFVHLQGVVAGGTLGSTVFTLPAGYRPAATVNLAGTGNGGAAVQVRITSMGAVTIPFGAAGGWNSITVAPFQAA